MYKRQNLNPLVATIFGTLWIVIVAAAYITIGVLMDKDGMWWGFGVFLMIGIAGVPFCIYAVVNAQ